MKVLSFEKYELSNLFKGVPIVIDTSSKGSSYIFKYYYNDLS